MARNQLNLPRGLESKPVETGAFTIGTNLTRMAFDPSTNSIWVTRFTNNQVTKINVLTGTHTSFTTPSVAYGVCYDPKTKSIWVTARDAGQVRKFSALDGSILGTFSTSTSPVDCCYDPSTESVWVCGLGGTVTKHDAVTGAASGPYTSAADFTYGICYDPFSRAIWTVNYNAGTARKFLAADGSVLGTFTVGTNPIKPAFDPYTNSIWVINSGSNNMTKLAALDGATLGTFTIGSGASDVQFDPSTNTVWVSNANDDYVGIYDPVTGARVNKMYADGPFGIAYDYFNGAMWTGENPAQLVRRYLTGISPALALADLSNLSPAAKEAIIAISGEGGGGGSGWALTGNAGTSPGTDFLGTTDAQALVIKTNNIERIRVLSGGNVGIGTATPGDKLVVRGTNIKAVVGDFDAHTAIYGAYLGQNTTGLEVGGSGAGPAFGSLTASSSLTGAGDLMGVLAFVTRGTSGTEKRAAQVSSQLDASSATQVNGNLQFHTALAGTLTERMRITSSGTVGIGTAAPLSASLSLDIATLSSNNDRGMGVTNGSVQWGTFTFPGSSNRFVNGSTTVDLVIRNHINTGRILLGTGDPGGSGILGMSISDTAVTVHTALMPSANNTLNIGSQSTRWSSIFVNNISSSGLSIFTTTVGGGISNSTASSSSGTTVTGAFTFGTGGKDAGTGGGVRTGAVLGSTGNAAVGSSGSFSFSTGTGAESSGGIAMSTGNANGGAAGNLTMQGGAGATNGFGALLTVMGGQPSGIGGGISLTPGNGSGGIGGHLTLASGAGSSGQNSGDVIIDAADGPSNGFGASATFQGGRNGGLGGSATISSGAGSGGNTGDLSLLTANAGTTFASGTLTIQTGTVVSGVRGKIRLRDGTEGIDGRVWTSIDANGSGSWLPVASFTATAGENLTIGDAVYVSIGAADGGRTAGRVYKLDATNDARVEYAGIVAATVLAGATATVQTAGEAQGLAGLTAGSPIWASVTTPGGFQTTAPSTLNQWIIQLGTCSSSTELLINGAGSATAIKITSSSAFNTPTTTKLTSGSGTYNTPAGVKWLRIRQVGGGGSGGGNSGTNSSGSATTFGTSFLTCNGGGGGNASATAGAGGTATIVGLTGIAVTGNYGVEGDNGTSGSGGAGAPGPWGGRGKGGNSSSLTGTDGVANSGAGGGGRAGAGGGGAGGYIDVVIPNPAASYAYSVGAGGNDTGGGTNGGSGVIIIEEHYSSSPSMAFNKYNPVLSAGDITNQYVDLPHLVMPNSVDVTFDYAIGYEGVEYTLSTVGVITRLTFAGDWASGGGSPLVAGDQLRIKYAY